MKTFTEKWWENQNIHTQQALSKYVNLKERAQLKRDRKRNKVITFLIFITILTIFLTLKIV